jgi:chitin disaccharide deacetylase
MQRSLIANADDFGQSPGINAGVIEAYERGIVTSASLMVRWPAAVEAAAYARAHPDLSLGLHFDLGEWSCHEGEWSPMYQVVPSEDAAAIAAELAWQVERFRELTGRNPLHLDSHQHVHREEPTRGVARQLARALGIPLRGHSRRVRYCGDFYGQSADGSPYPHGITFEALEAILARLRPGVTELGCHPGQTGKNGASTGMYCHERPLELAVLCDPRTRAALERHAIQLSSFDMLAGVR